LGPEPTKIRYPSLDYISVLFSSMDNERALTKKTRGYQSEVKNLSYKHTKKGKFAKV